MRKKGERGGGKIQAFKFIMTSKIDMPSLKTKSRGRKCKTISYKMIKSYRDIIYFNIGHKQKNTIYIQDKNKIHMGYEKNNKYMI